MILHKWWLQFNQKLVLMSKQAGLRLSFFWSAWFCWKLWAFRLPCNPASPGAGVGGLLLLLVQPCLALPMFIGVSSPFTLRSSFFFLLDFCPPPCTSLSCFHLFCSFAFSIDASPKLSCSGHIRVVTSMPFNISSLLCKLHMGPDFEIPLGVRRLLLLSTLSLYCVCKHGYIYSLARNTVYDN